MKTVARATLCLIVGTAVCRGADGNPEVSARIAQLTAEVAALRGALAEQEAFARTLRARNDSLSLDLAAFKGAVALASNGAPMLRDSPEAPSSSLGWDNALRAATAAKLMVDGAGLIAVMPTGSMEPMFNERAILLMEPARFEDLKVGDVVTFRDPGIGLIVVHRILERHGDKFWSKGDNNGRMDRVYITRENYGARVFGIIYAREPSAQARRFSDCMAER